MSMFNPTHDEIVETFELTLKCRNCKKDQSEHLEGKCLFEASSFEQMTAEELLQWSLTWLIDNKDRVGAVTGRLSAKKANISNLPKFKREYLCKPPDEGEDL